MVSRSPFKSTRERTRGSLCAEDHSKNDQPPTTTPNTLPNETRPYWKGLRASKGSVDWQSKFVLVTLKVGECTSKGLSLEFFVSTFGSEVLRFLRNIALFSSNTFIDFL